MLRVAWDAPDDAATRLHPLLVEFPHKLVMLTVDASGTQGTCVQASPPNQLRYRERDPEMVTMPSIEACKTSTRLPGTMVFLCTNPPQCTAMEKNNIMKYNMVLSF